MAPGPGVPDPPADAVSPQESNSRQRLADFGAVRAKAILGGVHFEFLLAPA